MIKTFTCRETENIFNREASKKLPPDIHRVALRKLNYLYAAKTLKDLFVPPGNNLERLKKNRQGQHSIRINNQWRICFEWRNGDAYNVEITDYH